MSTSATTTTTTTTDSPAPTNNRSNGETLQQLLPNITSHSPDPRAIGQFAQLAHRMASAYLGKKAKGGHLNPGFFGLSLEDLAFDCIAPLFERDAQGRLCQLVDYFEDPHQPPEALLAQLRRLVFSAVEQELFAHYGQMDPGLSKLIRNIKRAAKSAEDLSLHRPDGELWIYLTANPDNHRPIIPGELLERRLSAYLEENITAPQLLDALQRILPQQTLYRQALPVTLLAQAARSGLQHLKDEASPTNAHNQFQPERLQAEEIRQMIRAATQSVYENKHASYVESGKLSPQLYDTYFQTIEELLVDRFLQPTDTNTFYEQLNHHLEISHEEYHDQHRTRLEYLVQLTREHLLSLAKDEV